MALFSRPSAMPTEAEALPGRSERMAIPDAHYVNGNRIQPPFPAGLQIAMFGMGCFWGAERKFWQLRGVYSTSVGYAAGFTPNATRDAFQQALTSAGHGRITTEIVPAPEFYYAEDYHQQYLAKNPGGYCGLGGTGVSCPVGVATVHTPD